MESDGHKETFPAGSREVTREGRWLSYDELGRIRGIGRASAVKLAQREKWQRRRGNDQTARVLVPLEWLKPARRQPATFREEFPEGFPEFSRIVSALETAIAATKERTEADAIAISALREQLEQSSRRADRAEQGRDAERSRADALQDQVQGLLTQFTTLESDGKAANDRAWAAGEAAGELREQVAKLEQRVEAERTRADRAEAGAASERRDFLDAESRTRRELDTIRQRLEQAEQNREAAADLQRRVEAAQTAQAEAEAEAVELRQADAVRKARGRLRHAWNGWRGR
jgi:hypothetical protein